VLLRYARVSGVSTDILIDDKLHLPKEVTRRAPAPTKTQPQGGDMPVDIDYSSLPKFRKKLPEKLKQIRERAGLTPEEFAPHVHAKDGKAIEKYEKGKSDLPVSVLMRYWKLSDVPLENILNDDRDLWFGH
jgi:DNA-binding XRE family transcriptional regulator